MADTSQYTDIYGNRVQYGVYRFFTTSTNPQYVHMKTNKTSCCQMVMIEAVGQNFGNSQAIRCSWNFYRYTGTSTINTQVNTVYPGLSADGMYTASDGATVIRAYAGGLYYAGWTLNAYTTAGAGIGQPLRITEAIQTTESGAYY